MRESETPFTAIAVPIEDEEIPPKIDVPSRWFRFKSFLSPCKSAVKMVVANTIEFAGTGLLIASEIATFAGGMGFFIAPPLKRMYAKIIGNNLSYTVWGAGEVCIETALSNNTILPPVTMPIGLFTNSSVIGIEHDDIFCKRVNNFPLTSSQIPFNVSFPENLFAASILIFGLGCGGIAAANAIQKYGSYLHHHDKRSTHSKEQVALANKLNKPLFVACTLLFLGSRAAALYATTTISLMLTLRNVPSILEDFSISSAELFVYKPSVNITKTASEKIIMQLIKIIRVPAEIVTYIDFAMLRTAAKKGSNEIEDYYFPLSLILAAVALILAYAALKVKQKRDQYIDTIQRERHYSELNPLLEQQTNTITKLEKQILELKQKNTQLESQRQSYTNLSTLLFSCTSHTPRTSQETLSDPSPNTPLMFDKTVSPEDIESALPATVRRLTINPTLRCDM